MAGGNGAENGGGVFPDFLAARRDRTRFPLGFRDTGDFAAWRAEGRAALREAVGPALAGEASAEEIGRDETGGLTRLRLRFAFPTGATTEALMLLPPGPAPLPAVVLFHDHGSEFRVGKEKLIDPWDDPERAGLAAAWRDRVYGGVSLGAALAARGHAVIAADALGWGARAGVGYEGQQALAANLMQFGLTLAGLVAAEDAQLVRWLARRPGIDPTRIAAYGFSFGGFRAWQAAALCPEIATAVAAGWMGRLRDLARPGGNQLRGQSAFYMLHPALGGRMDYPDIAGLAAPRPMLFLGGRRDPHFPAAEAAHDDLRAIWHAAGAPEALETGLTDDAHVHSPEQRARATDFLARRLRLPRAPDPGPDQGAGAAGVSLAQSARPPIG